MIEQVQRAFDHTTKGLAKQWEFHSSPLDKSKRSSKISRSIRDTSRAFISDGLKIKTAEDRSILEAFSKLDFEQFQPGVSQEEFMNSGLSLRDTKPEFQASLKQSVYREVQDRLLGLKYRDYLSMPEARSFWYWAREHWLDAMEWAMEKQASFKGITPIEIVPDSANRVLEKSIIYLLGEFGRGIRRIQGGKPIPGVEGAVFRDKT